MKYNERKFINFLERRKIYFDIFFKGFLSLLTIFIAFQANEIIQYQNKIMEREVAPSFSFSQLSNDSYDTVYKMKNEKGYISNISFEKIDVITTYYKGITFYNYFQRGNMNDVFNVDDEESWLFIPSDQKFDSDEIVDFIDEYVQTKGLVGASSYCSSYYHVIYNNYQNQRYEEYYKINNDKGSAIYEMNYISPEELSEKINTSKNFSFMTHHTGTRKESLEHSFTDSTSHEMWDMMIKQIERLSKT